MTIKELEQRTGLPRTSIRFYEQEGLLNPEAERVDLRYTHMGADLTIPISLEVTGP